MCPRVPESRRAWRDDDFAKLKSLAGGFRPGKSLPSWTEAPTAVMVEASKLKVSLSGDPARQGQL